MANCLRVQRDYLNEYGEMEDSGELQTTHDSTKNTGNVSSRRY